MTIINSNRRQFLQYTALGLATAAFPNLISAKTNPIKNFPSRSFKADVELAITSRKANISILRKGPTTRVQKYYAKLLKGPKQTLQHLKGNYLGPILNFQAGQKVRVYYYNDLSEASIIHWHGLHVPQESDGHPMYSVEPGERYVYEFEIKNKAGTSFYHSHSHLLTAEQVYQGLAGLITVTDEEESNLELPSGEYDIPLVLQDRTFTDRNKLQYLDGMHAMHGRMTGFLGVLILVNGKPNVEFSVKSRAYRFRTLNGSNSRIYKLGWDDGTPLVAIACDANLLPKPESRPYIMLAPGERVDLWLDFSGRSKGSKLVMYSLPFSGAMPPMFEKKQNNKHGRGMGMMGGMNNKGKGKMMGMKNSLLPHGAKFPIASFVVNEIVSDSPKLPKQLAKLSRLTEKDTDNANNPLPIAISMQPMAPKLNGKSFEMTGVSDIENIPLGSIKKLKIFHDHGKKGMGKMGMMLSMAHPIHLHGQQYQIISRKIEGMRKNDYETVKDGFINSGWKDTVLVMPGEEIEIIKPFQDYKGLFLYHCHNLEHEDLGMMRQFNIT